MHYVIRMTYTRWPFSASVVFYHENVWKNISPLQYSDVIMGAMAPQITSLAIVYSIVNPGADQRKHQSFVSLDFVWGIHRRLVNSPQQWPVTRKMFPFDHVIILPIIWDENTNGISFGKPRSAIFFTLGVRLRHPVNSTGNGSLRRVFLLTGLRLETS